MLIIGIAGIRAARRAARRAALAGPRRAAHRAVESHAKPHRVAVLWGEGGWGASRAERGASRAERGASRTEMGGQGGSARREGVAQRDKYYIKYGEKMGKSHRSC